VPATAYFAFGENNVFYLFVYNTRRSTGVMKILLHLISAFMATIIRQATLTDINELIRWRMRSLRETFAGHKGIDFSRLRQANLNFYRRAMSMESYVGCFADQGYAAVGYGGLCLYHETPTPENPSGCCAYLMNVYTGPSVRDQGIGRRIVDWLVAEARRRGAAQIYLTRKSQPEYACLDGEFGCQTGALA